MRNDNSGIRKNINRLRRRVRPVVERLNCWVHARKSPLNGPRFGAVGPYVQLKFWYNTISAYVLADGVRTYGQTLNSIAPRSLVLMEKWKVLIDRTSYRMR